MRFSDDQLIKSSIVDSGTGCRFVKNCFPPLNKHTGFHVNSKFTKVPNVFFASWDGGGLDVMPQNYTVLRKTKETFTAIDEKSWLYGGDVILYKDMHLVD